MKMFLENYNTNAGKLTSQVLFCSNFSADFRL